VDNFGPDSATGLVVTDTLPAGVTFLSATPTNYTYDSVNGTVTWYFGELWAYSRLDLTIDVTAPATTGTIINNASVRSNENDGTRKQYG
jgi:hypothetical protein